MRVNNAKNMGRTADQSTSSAKRALLLAVIIASTSTVNAYSPDGGSNDSQSVGPAPSANPVDQNTELVVQQGIGTVRKNPFVPLTRRVPNLVARPTMLILTSDLVRPLTTSEGEESNDQAKSRFTAPVNVAPIDVLGKKDSRVIPVADAREEHQAITETQPIFFTLSDGAPISEREQPAAVSRGKTQSDAAETENLDPPDRTASHAATPNVVTAKEDDNGPDGPICETTDAPAHDKSNASLTSVSCPVKLAPVIDLSSPGALPSSRSVAEPVTASVNRPVAKTVAVPGSEQLAASAANRVSPARQSTTVSMPTVRINLNAPEPSGETPDSSGAHTIEVAPELDASVAKIDSGLVQESETFNPAEPTEHQDLNNDPDPSSTPKLLSPKLKRTAIAVASLPVPIQRVDVDGSKANPIIETVTHDPSRPTEVVTSEQVTMAMSDRSDRNNDVSLVTPRVAKSVLAKHSIIARSTLAAQDPLEQLPKLPPSAKSRSETPESQHGSLLKSESVPAKLVTSKQNLQSTKKPTPGQRRDPIVLHLSRAQVRSMTIGGDLRAVSVGDKNICQAFEAGASQIKLIGTGLGKTTLTIWADVKPGEPTRTQSFEIEVSDGVNATGDKVSERTTLLNESIDKAFPRASVVVSRHGGELNVTGRCDTEAEAKQIIRLVRKSCLVPVQDNLKVRQL